MNGRGAAVRAAALAAGLLIAGVPTSARAVEVVAGEQGRLDLGGDLKSYFLGFAPPSVMGDAGGQGALDLRLKLEGGVGRWLRFSFHHQATFLGQSQEMTGGFSPLGATAATTDGEQEAVDLTWTALDREDDQFGGRVDRLWLLFRLPHLDLTVGRQPISFGAGYFFTPMDLATPFVPMAVDREYKPGVDAVRADAYFGTSGKVTAVAAYAGGWDWEGLIAVVHGGATLGLFDLGLFGGSVRGDTVVGLDAAGSVGGFGVHGEGTVTFPAREGEDRFVRAVAGTDYYLTTGLTLQGELYWQSLGADGAGEYADFLLTNQRLQRGELWTMGHYYGAVSAAYELTPLINLSLAVIANLGDPSCLLGPGLTWSLSDSTELVAGAYLPLGGSPEEGAFAPRLRSEYGTYPAIGYLQVQGYY